MNNLNNPAKDMDTSSLVQELTARGYLCLTKQETQDLEEVLKSPAVWHEVRIHQITHPKYENESA